MIKVDNQPFINLIKLLINLVFMHKTFGGESYSSKQSYRLLAQGKETFIIKRKSQFKHMTTIQEKINWWQGLEPQWQKAINQVMLRKGEITDTPDEEGFNTIFEHKFLRFAGPKAPYPSVSFELTNLSGLAAFDEAEMISVTYHQIASLKEITHLKHLKNVFLDNNCLTSLEGVENLSGMEELHVHVNQIESIKPIESLTKLKAFYCGSNKLTSFDGLTEDHSDNLRFFVCMPNEDIKQKEILRVENTLGIKCRGIQ